MDKAFRGILDLVCRDTAFVVTILFVAVFALVWTVVFGPSFEVSLNMLGLGVATALIEFRRGPSA